MKHYRCDGDGGKLLSQSRRLKEVRIVGIAGGCGVGLRKDMIFLVF